MLLGNGDGTFQAPRYFPGGPLVTAVLVADFDNDGKLDLVVQNYNGLAILYGKGDGTFRDPVQYDIPAAMRQMQVADFNGDRLPAVSVVLYGGSVDVFLNAGNAPRPPPRGREKQRRAFRTSPGSTSFGLAGSGVNTIERAGIAPSVPRFSAVFARVYAASPDTRISGSAAGGATAPGSGRGSAPRVCSFGAAGGSATSWSGATKTGYDAAPGTAVCSGSIGTAGSQGVAHQGSS